MNLIVAYVPHAGRHVQEKAEYYFTLLGKIVSEIDDGEKIADLWRLEWTCGAGVEGCEGVHGRFEFGKRNVEGEIILEFADT